MNFSRDQTRSFDERVESNFLQDQGNVIWIFLNRYIAIAIVKFKWCILFILIIFLDDTTHCLRKVLIMHYIIKLRNICLDMKAKCWNYLVLGICVCFTHPNYERKCFSLTWTIWFELSFRGHEKFSHHDIFSTHGWEKQQDLRSIIYVDRNDCTGYKFFYFHFFFSINQKLLRFHSQKCV